MYWQTVITRGYSEEATLPPLPDLAAMEAFREQTAGVTRSYLERATEAELNTPRQMISDPGETRLLRPADVIMRVVTHIFNHQGQVLAMCREHALAGFGLPANCCRSTWIIRLIE